jgi:hypothetical protein
MIAAKLDFLTWRKRASDYSKAFNTGEYGKISDDIL